MSEYTPDLSDAQSYYVAGRAQIRRQITGEQVIDITEYSHEFDRWLAEVERAAAEKAWDACDDAITAVLVREGGLSATLFNAWPDNPYRAALGLTAGQEGKIKMETCTFCDQQVDSVTVGSDGIAKACADCMGEAEVRDDG